MQKKKNIGLLISELNNGGAERVVSRLSKILQDDYNIFLILFEDKYIMYDFAGTLVNLDIPSVTGKLSKIKLLMLRAIKLKKKKKELELDCVISFLDSPNLVNILSRTRLCRTVISIRNYSAFENQKSTWGIIINYLYRLLYNKADRIVPVTKVIEKLYVESYGISKEKMRVIYNPYELDDIEKLMHKEPSLNTKSFLGKTVFITVGRQMYQKGYWHLLKVFRKVHELNSNTILLMVGSKDESVVEFIRKYNMQDCIILAGTQSNPFSLMYRSDIYVLTSIFEGFPNALAEAMVCGLPIVAADCQSGPREILAPNTAISTVCDSIEEAEYGVLVHPMEKEENWNETVFTTGEEFLFKAMMKLLDNDEMRKEYGIKAQKRAREFDYTVCKEKYIELIEELF